MIHALLLIPCLPSPFRSVLKMRLGRLSVCKRSIWKLKGLFKRNDEESAMATTKKMLLIVFEAL